MTEAQVLVATHEGILQIRVLGRATFKVSHDLREFALKLFQEKPADPRKACSSIIIDLSACEGMDSTFMGVMAMIGLERYDTVDLLIVNANASHRQLLDSIGVSLIWTYAKETVSDVSWESLCEAAVGAVDMSAVSGTVLAAHKALMDLTPENVPKFKDVVELLSAEIENSEHE